MLGLGGAFHDLALDGGLTFQPLVGIDDAATRAWAAEWVQGLLVREGVTLDPAVKEAVWTALNSLASAPPEARTLTGLAILMQSSRIGQALQPYTAAGPFGRLLDSASDSLDLGDIQPFEMADHLRTPAMAPT